MLLLTAHSQPWTGFLGQVFGADTRILAGALGLMLVAITLHLLGRKGR